MRTTNRRDRGLFTTFAFAVALGVYSSGLTASAGQPPQIPPQQSGVVAPFGIVLPLTPNTGPASGVADRAFSNPPAGVDGSTSPTCCDPISRVPNFFGDFVARPSVGFVNEPITVSGSSNTTVSTRTLSFVGLPTDLNGGTGQNQFFPPFRPNGIVGPGGPYPITTIVDGFGISIPPLVSILRENAELTAQIQAKFPGAIFAGGIGLLEPPAFPLLFEYIQSTTGQTLTPSQIVPGLVALVSLSNPSGGGMVGRNKYFDDGSPVPRDRVFLDYDHVDGFKGLGTPIDINRYVFGVEKTFLCGRGSVEVRVPFAGTVNTDQNGGQALDVDNAELGNIGLLVKGAVFRNANWIVTAGMGVSMPTADDSRILFNGSPVLEIRNHAWLLQPILGAAWAPNDRFYVQAGVQCDFDANGNPVFVHEPGGEFDRRGFLTDQTYLYASGAVGYWLYQGGCGILSRLGLQGELHYNRTLGNRDFVQTGSVLVTDLNDNIDVLNATAGVNVVLRDRATLSLGVSVPVSSDRLCDWNLMARLNFQFGKVAR